MSHIEIECDRCQEKDHPNHMRTYCEKCYAPHENYTRLIRMMEVLSEEIERVLKESKSQVGESK